MSGLETVNLDEGDEIADNGDWDMLGDQGLGDENINEDDQGHGDQAQVDGSNAHQDMASDVEAFDMVNDFDDNNMDTAGDALADYGTGDADGDDLNLNDSAFDDAFHHEQQEES